MADHKFEYPPPGPGAWDLFALVLAIAVLILGVASFLHGEKQSPPAEAPAAECEL